MKSSWIFHNPGGGGGEESDQTYFRIGLTIFLEGSNPAMRDRSTGYASGVSKKCIMRKLTDFVTATGWKTCVFT